LENKTKLNRKVQNFLGRGESKKGVDGWGE